MAAALRHSCHFLGKAGSGRLNGFAEGVGVSSRGIRRHPRKTGWSPGPR